MYGKMDGRLASRIAFLEETSDCQDRVLGMLEDDIETLKDDPYEALAMILDLLPLLIAKVGGPDELECGRVQDIAFELACNAGPATGRRMLKLVETFFMEGNLKEIGEIAILLVIALSGSGNLSSDTLRLCRRFMTRSGEMDEDLLSFIVSETVNAMMDLETDPEEIYAFSSPYMALQDVREEFTMRNWPLSLEEAKRRPGGLRSLSWYVQIS